MENLKKKPVDFALLVALTDELGAENTLADTLEILAMEGMEFSDPVYKLGVLMGILIDKEEQDEPYAADEAEDAEEVESNAANPPPNRIPIINFVHMSTRELC